MEMIYEWWQWLLYFYVYCFAGWIWECLYVSVRTGKFVNRGFLHLPLLPLYGSGAVVVLFSSLPFKSHAVLVFGAGMAAATLLELVTGLSMETLYKVKYWDYSDCFMNFKGVICLKASLCWGVFSLLMVGVVHVRVENLLAPLPVTWVMAGEAVLTAAVTYDFYVSNREALQLARVLSAMEKAKQEMEEELRKLEAELEEQKKQMEAQLQQAREKAEEEIAEGIFLAIVYTQNAQERAAALRHHMEESAELRVEETRRRIQEMRQSTEHAVEEAKLNAMFRREEMFERMQNMREKYLEEQEARLEKAGRLSRSMLLRNPSARVAIHSEMSSLLRHMAENWIK